MFYYNAHRTLELRIAETIRHAEGKCEEHQISIKVCPPCLAYKIMNVLNDNDIIVL